MAAFAILNDLLVVDSNNTYHAHEWAKQKAEQDAKKGQS